jgi:hypothetical protein
MERKVDDAVSGHLQVRLRRCRVALRDQYCSFNAEACATSYGPVRTSAQSRDIRTHDGSLDPRLRSCLCLFFIY